MKKYLFGLSVAVILFFNGCTAKNETSKTVESSANMATGSGVTSLEHKDLLVETSIHDAVRTEDIKLVQFYIGEKTNVNVKDMLGYTPLHLAARFNYLQIAQELIDSGASVNSVDNYGDTPLLDSTRNGYTEMSKLLICNGAKRDVLDKYGMSPLHYASKTEDEQIASLLRSENIQEACAKKEKKVMEKFIDLITMDDYGVINDNTPKLCGDILDDSVKDVNLSLNNSEAISANIDKDAKRWCVEVNETLDNGEYVADALALNDKGEKGKANDDFEIYVLNDLYTALNNEFAPDFDKWDAELDKDTLTFRFKNPSLMFARGSSQISENYKEILDDFFPRYINILKDYSSEIINVTVEGHTSSRYRTAKTVEEKFMKNKILSQKRANTVLDYLKSINEPRVDENRMFIDKTFMAEGKSSSQLVLDEYGVENHKLSRRVEFRIETNPNK